MRVVPREYIGVVFSVASAGEVDADNAVRKNLTVYLRSKVLFRVGIVQLVVVVRSAVRAVVFGEIPQQRSRQSRF